MIGVSWNRQSGSDKINEYVENFIVAGGTLMMENRFTIYIHLLHVLVHLYILTDPVRWALAAKIINEMDLFICQRPTMSTKLVCSIFVKRYICLLFTLLFTDCCAKSTACVQLMINSIIPFHFDVDFAQAAIWLSIAKNEIRELNWEWLRRRYRRTEDVSARTHIWSLTTLTMSCLLH